ncbi:MAG: hypothetical protein KDC00_06000 [Flavobacteriales bacterium]|nr:hypothetical protein [Flavobacteriales bacterium]
MFKPFAPILLAILPTTAAIPQLQYASPLFGSGSGIAYDAISTADGGQVICGGFTETMDLDPGAGMFEVTSVGGEDAWVAKFDASGGFLWGLNVGSDGDDQARAITVDENGDIHVAGYFVNSIDLDPGVGVSVETSAGDRDVFLLKLDGNGQYLWSGRIGGTLRQFPTGIDRDLAGHIYICGYIAGTADFDPGPGILNVSTTNPGLITETNISFLAKYDLSGSPVWAYTLGGITPHIAVEQGGNAIYLTNGHGADATTLEDFDPQSGTLRPVNNGQPEADYMSLIKYDGSANVLWSVFVRGYPSFEINFNKGNALALDVNGDVYWAGVFLDDFTEYPGNDVTLAPVGTGIDGFLLKYGSNGELLWEKRFGAPDADDTCTELMFGNDGSIWVAGAFHDTAELNSAGTSVTAVSAGEWDIFLAAFEPSGEYVWHGSLGGPGFDGIPSLTANGGEIRLSGYFSATADLDPTTGLSTHSAIGPNDAFISSFTPSISSSLIDNTLSPSYPIYPNPASTIVFFGPGWSTGSLEVIDAVGRRVPVPPYIDRLDVSAWNEGVYLIRSAGIATARLIVVH